MLNTTKSVNDDDSYVIWLVTLPRRRVVQTPGLFWRLRCYCGNNNIARADTAVESGGARLASTIPGRSSHLRTDLRLQSRLVRVCANRFITSPVWLGQKFTSRCAYCRELVTQFVLRVVVCAVRCARGIANVSMEMRPATNWIARKCLVNDGGDSRVPPINLEKLTSRARGRRPRRNPTTVDSREKHIDTCVIGRACVWPFDDLRNAGLCPVQQRVAVAL